MNFFSVVKSYSISPVLKTFNHRMRTFIILVCPRCTVVTVRLQCIMKKLGSCVFQGLYWSPICFPCVWKKKYIVLEKVWKKSWILDPKICTNPVCWSYLDKTLHFLNSFDTWKLRATEPQVTFTQRIAGSVPVSVQLSCHCLEFRAETRTLEWCFSTWNSTQAGIKEFSSGKRRRNKYRL